jgi:hypothetical protein
MIMAPGPLARSAAHACLLEVFGDDFGRLDLQAAGRVITDLLGMAHDEGFADLHTASLEYRRRIHPGSLANYARLLPTPPADQTDPQP